MLLLLLLAVVSAAFSFNSWSLVHRNSSFIPFVANLFSTPLPETYEPSSTAEELPEEILLSDIPTDWSWEKLADWNPLPTTSPLTLTHTTITDHKLP